jgi:precorrin-6A/cobalt-precorrin-6A reductase
MDSHGLSRSRWDMRRRVLILGGTTEARLLAAQLAQRESLEVTLSLAGRTSAPLPQAVPTRHGGFGGVAGLTAYLSAAHIDLLIDATHPYAARISAIAIRAARASGVPLLAIRRPPWAAVPGDRWMEVADVDEAVTALGEMPCRVFLALGRQDLQPFVRAPQHHYVIRSVDPVDPPLAIPHARYILARGPFEEAADRELLQSNRIDRVVAKNSGGDATYSKIAAARSLGIQVVLVRRPPDFAPASVGTVEEAVRWTDRA